MTSKTLGTIKDKSLSERSVGVKRLADAKKLLAKFEYQQATDILEDIVDSHQDISEAFYLLGLCLIDQFRYMESIVYLNKAVESVLDNPKYFSILGLAYYKVGSLTQALKNYLEALKLDENNFSALNGLGDIYYDKNKYDLAEKYYSNAVEVKSSSAEVQMKLARVLSDLGEYKEALFHAEKAIKQSPKDPNAYWVCGRVHLVAGKIESAERLYKKSIDLDPSSGFYYAEYVNVKKITDPDDPVIRRMEKILKSSISMTNRRSMHFALGQAYNDCHQWDKAFLNFRKGNVLVQTSYNQKNELKMKKKIMKVFSASVFDKFKGLGDEDISPIFIIGMPRSGSTLIDQVLDSHSKVHSMGESAAFPNVDGFISNTLGVDYPQYISKLTDELISNACKKHIEEIQIEDGASIDGQLTVDKMLYNYMYLGLIAILFPKAKIIHSMRNPLDSSLSCFNIHFISNGVDNEWSSSFDNIGFCYRMYREIMEHWKKVLPIPVLDVRYESMVENLEDNARHIIKFCGLEWEPQCLEFYKSKRSVQTASVTQVRKPIYKSSVARWEPYAKYLIPLVEQLGDIVKDDYKRLRELGCEFKVKEKGLFKRFF